MGLDINPLSKPKPGHEEEFRALFLRLEVAQGKRPSQDGTGFIGRFPKRREDAAPLIVRFQEISIPPYAAIGAPVVGQDEAADKWVRSAFAAGSISAKTETEALEQMTGYYALQAMPESDGFPVYTHAYDYEGVDRTSFRGKFLESCEDVIGKDLLVAAWNNMLADELAGWAEDLRAAVDLYAAEQGVERVLDDRAYRPEDLETPDARAHIVDQAARWATFWSDRGHGSEAYF